MFTLVPRLMVLVVAWQLTCSFAFGQDEEEEEYAPGLIATEFRASKPFERLDLTVSLPKAEELSDALHAKESVTTTWRGYLFTQGRGDYRFHVYAQGFIQFKLLGQSLIDTELTSVGWRTSNPVNLSYGYHAIEVTLRGTRESTRLKLFWDGPQFQLEPIPPRHFFHERAKYPETSPLIKMPRRAAKRWCEPFAVPLVMTSMVLVSQTSLPNLSI